MKFTVERDAALRALTLATRITEKRNTIPMLGHAAITAGKSRVTLAVTNMDQHMVVEMATANTSKTGQTTANAGRMLAFVRATAPGSQIEAELKDEKLILRAGRARATLPTLPIGEFPVIPSQDAGAEIEVAGDALAHAIGQVSHAQSDEETRYYLNGVYFHERAGKLRLVATDGHRLGLAEVTPEKKLPETMPGIILPRGAVPELVRIASDAKQSPITLEISEHRLRVAHGDVEFSTKLVDGVFPDYDRVIPKQNDCRFSVGRVALEGAIARCAALGSDGSNAVKIEVIKGAALLSRHTPDAGEVSDEVDVQAKGEPSTTGFNSAYMTSALAALACPDIDVEFTPGGPLVLRRSTDDRDGEMQLVMAMRVI